MKERRGKHCRTRGMPPLCCPRQLTEMPQPLGTHPSSSKPVYLLYNRQQCYELPGIQQRTIPKLWHCAIRFEPGPTFTRSTAAPVLDCSGLDADTHEIWLLQLPLDVRWALCCMHVVLRQENELQPPLMLAGICAVEL